MIDMTIPEALFLVLALLCMWVILKGHKQENGWNFFDMVSTDGLADVRKFMFLLVGVSMVWVLFYLAVSGNLSEWYVIAVMGGYVVADGAALWARKIGNNKE
jgi:hypothetical protein